MSTFSKIVFRRLRKAFVPIFERDIRFFSNENGVITSGLPDLDIPKVSLNEFALENYGKWENHVAAECGVTGRRYTFKEVVTKSKNFGNSLRKKFHLEKNDVVALILPNIPEYPIIANGAIGAGLVCTPVNPTYTSEEISRQLLDCSAKTIITVTDLYPLASQVKNIIKKDIPILTVNSQKDQTTPAGCANFTEFADNNIDPVTVSVSNDDLAFLPYSSGTTGLPKGVQLTHRNLIANICQLAHPDITFSFETTPTHQDVTLAVLPMFHIYGLNVLCFFQLKMGCKIVTVPKFIPELYIHLLRNQKPDILYLVPPLVLFLANHPGVRKEDLDGIRTIVNGAAALGVLDGAKLVAKCQRDLPILQGYGLTETSPAVLTTRQCHTDNKSVSGTLGSPVPNTQVKVIDIDDPNGTPLGARQVGELLVKGPQVMKGYLNRPEEKPFLDGWFRTGDMMYYDENDYLYFTDRLKELIKVKGFQVAPAELEEIIRDFPGVLESAVVGVKHDFLGEVPKAYVVPRPGVKLDCDKLSEFVSKKVAPHKQLKGGISIIQSIPKSASGKMLKKELKLQYQTDKI